MGKKRIVKTEGETGTEDVKKTTKVSSKRKVETGILYVRSTFNNTELVLTDKKGNVLASESSGKLGFKGAKKGTPFAAAKVGEALAVKAQTIGIKEVGVVVKGIGSGRESGIRGFISKGVNISYIRDATPVPHNGPKPRKPRRV
ncbi:MAG: 30S ribosomal protein S11 [Parcubacteria group bacterium]|jgi:small subunit ribosomal protein S11|nr:30S ribosomal protein S11 [Parcubacteria group bacterium]